MISFLFCTFLKSNTKNPMCLFVSLTLDLFKELITMPITHLFYFCFWVKNTGSVIYSYREQGIQLTFLCIIKSGACQGLSCDIFTDQKFPCILMNILYLWEVKDLVAQVNGISTTFSAISWGFWVKRNSAILGFHWGNQVMGNLQFPKLWVFYKVPFFKVLD